MNQDQNLPEENSQSGNPPEEDQIPISQKEEVNEIISPPETIEQPEPETHNSTLQTENMEVHHHPQLEHKPKPWKEYILEYIMIVLAVTTGFFAESYRESLVNSEKEHHYIVSMVRDLKQDTSDITVLLYQHQLLYNKMDSALQIPVERMKDINTQDTFYHYFFFINIMGPHCIANINTITQLKNAGGFAVIKNQDVIDSITSHYSFYDEHLKLQDQYLKSEYWDLMHQGELTTKFSTHSIASFDDPVFSIIPKNTKIFIQDDEAHVQPLYNMIAFYKGNLLYYIAQENEYKIRAGRLTDFLTKEYHLENE